MQRQRILLVLMLVASVLFALALNTLTMSTSRQLWILGILFSENGHWFAILCAALLVTTWRLGGAKEWVGRFALLMFVSAIYLLIQPTFIAASHEREWREEFQKSFGLEQKEPWFRWSHLIAFKADVPNFDRHEFKSRDGATIAYDLYPGQGNGPHPVVIVAHGGGWDSGESGQLPALNVELNKLGYTIASVDYRLAPGAQWPRQREDVEDAIADLKSRSTELSLDMNGVFLLGRSAGGQIVGALAYEKPPICVKGFISFYAPTDMTFGYEVSDEDHWLRPRLLLRQFLNGDPFQKPEAYKSASPLDFVSSETPPTLMLYGRPDSLVWFKHGERLETRLKLAKVPSFRLDLPWGQHGFDFFLNGPGGQLSTSAVIAFLESQKHRCEK